VPESANGVKKLLLTNKSLRKHMKINSRSSSMKEAREMYEATSSPIHSLIDDTVRKTRLDP